MELFGPLRSRRFGLSLGIDLSASKKQCNFDCLYCELSKSKAIERMESVEFNEEAFSELLGSTLERFKKSGVHLDVITITANGEPTLFPYLKRVVSIVNSLKNSSKSLILSNGSTIYKKEIQDALLPLDIVKLSLDCVSSECFKKLDRNHKGVDVDKIVGGMVEFRARFKGELVLESLFVKGQNDNKREIELLYEAIKRIKPDRYDIGTIDRPPAYDVLPLGADELELIAKEFEGLNVFVAKRSNMELVAKSSFDREQILELLRRRPITKDDVESTFDEESQKILALLLDANEVGVKNIAGVEFYTLCYNQQKTDGALLCKH